MPTRLQAYEKGLYSPILRRPLLLGLSGPSRQGSLNFDCSGGDFSRGSEMTIWKLAAEKHVEKGAGGIKSDIYLLVQAGHCQLRLDKYLVESKT